MDTTKIKYLLEWPKSGILTIPNAVKDVEQQECSSTSGVIENGATMLEDSLAVFSKVKHSITRGANNFTSRYLLNWLENPGLSLLKPNETPAYECSFIHNNPKFRAIKMSSRCEWIIKLQKLHLFNGKIFNNKKTWTKKREERNLIAHYQVKKACPQILHTILLQLYDVLQKVKI